MQKVVTDNENELILMGAEHNLYHHRLLNGIVIIEVYHCGDSSCELMIKGEFLCCSLSSVSYSLMEGGFFDL
ncbi:hypothetical protein QYZ87_05675 [Porphyromonadaceae bacterium W3.11]|nr:hypothetical protein [Porphyromonadaceae bacterium W3.11]